MSCHVATDRHEALQENGLPLCYPPATAAVYHARLLILAGLPCITGLNNHVPLSLLAGRLHITCLHTTKLQLALCSSSATAAHFNARLFHAPSFCIHRNLSYCRSWLAGLQYGLCQVSRHLVGQQTSKQQPNWSLPPWRPLSHMPYNIPLSLLC